MKKILLFMLLTLLPAAALAQGQQDSPQPARPPAQQPAKTGQDSQKTAQQGNEQQKNPAADVSDTFIPSEQISDDLSVAFPVDM